MATCRGSVLPGRDFRSSWRRRFASGKSKRQTGKRCLTLRKPGSPHGLAWVFICLTASAISAVPLAAEEPPTVFAPGVISGPAHDAAPAFSPDGKTVYFGRSNAVQGAILVSTLGERRALAGTEGRTLLRRVARPRTRDGPGRFLPRFHLQPAGRSGGAPVEAFYNGKTQPGGNLWRVERKGDGWGEPFRLPERINRSGSVFAPCVVADGSLYFMEAVGEKHRFRLFRSQWQARRIPGPAAGRLQRRQRDGRGPRRGTRRVVRRFRLGAKARARHRPVHRVQGSQRRLADAAASGHRDQQSRLGRRKPVSAPISGRSTSAATG